MNFDFNPPNELPPKEEWRRNYYPSELLVVGADLSEIQKEFGYGNTYLLNSAFMDKVLHGIGKEFARHIDLSGYKNPIVKNIVARLYFIRYRLGQLFDSSLDEKLYEQYELVDNLIKKVKINQDKEWAIDDDFQSDDTEVLDDENPFRLQDLFVLLKANPDELVNIAKLISAKMTIQPENLNSKTFIDYEAHIKRCEEMKFDPRDLSEEESLKVYIEWKQALEKGEFK